jgi:hypothetical protein
MTKASNRWAVIFAAVAILGTLEQILFGRDTPGVAHDVSVVAWVASLLAAAGFMVVVVARLARFASARRR